MFHKFILDLETNLFDKLSTVTEFENVIPGRLGANLLDCRNDLVPIVRTTTVYKNPAQKFLPVHYHIIEKIRAIVTPKTKKYPYIDFNNALIEIYDSRYCNMGFHSDQAQDLASESFICLFSCYQNPPESKDIRKKKIKKKESINISKESKESIDSHNISLDNNSIVIFSLQTNAKNLHKIILDSTGSTNRWLGITFRLSKTFIHFVNEIPFFVHNKEILRVADTNEKKEFFKLRGLENSKTEFNYPELNYTLSPADLMPIK